MKARFLVHLRQSIHSQLHKRRLQIAIGLGLFFFFILLSIHPAFADDLTACTQSLDPATDSNGFLDKLQTFFTTPMGNMVGASLKAGQTLFMALASIEILWFTIETVWRKREITDIVGSLAFRFISLGVMMALMMTAGSAAFSTNLAHDFGNMGASIGSNAGFGVGAVSSNQSVGTLLNNGFKTANLVISEPFCKFKKVMESVKPWVGPVPNVFGAIMAVMAIITALPMLVLELGLWLLVMFTFVYLVAQLLLAIVEMTLVLSAGVFLLGFSGSSWTMGYAQSYWRYAFAAGIRIFTIQLVAAIGIAVITKTVNDGVVADYQKGLLDLSALAIPALDPSTYILVFAMAVFVLMLTMRVPAIANAFLSGAPALSLADVSHAAELGTALASAPILAAAAALTAGAGLAAGGGAAAAAASEGGVGAAAAGEGAGSIAAAGGGGGGAGLKAPAAADAVAGGGKSGAPKVGAPPAESPVAAGDGGGGGGGESPAPAGGGADGGEGAVAAETAGAEGGVAVAEAETPAVAEAEVAQSGSPAGAEAEAPVAVASAPPPPPPPTASAGPPDGSGSKSSSKMHEALKQIEANTRSQKPSSLSKIRQAIQKHHERLVNQGGIGPGSGPHMGHLG